MIERNSFIQNEWRRAIGTWGRGLLVRV